MNSFLLVSALIVCAFAQQGPTCLPNAFQFQRSSDLQGFGIGFGWDLTTEYYDYIGKRFRHRSNIWEQGNQIFFDTLILASENKLYQIYTHSGSGSINCTVHTGTFVVPPACLLGNATFRNAFLMAGEVLTNNYFESAWDPSANGMVYEEIALAAATNVPIARRIFIQGTGNNNGNGFDIYYNFAPNYPGDAFAVPSFCQQSATKGKTFTAAETTQIMKTYLGAFPQL